MEWIDVRVDCKDDTVGLGQLEDGLVLRPHRELFCRSVEVVFREKRSHLTDDRVILWNFWFVLFVCFLGDLRAISITITKVL